MDFLTELHGSIRWLVALALVGGIALAFIALVQQRWSRLHAGVLRSIAILLTLQLLLGAVLLIRLGIDAEWSFAALRIPIEHAVTMLIAVGLAHMLPRMAQAQAIRARAARVLLVLLAILMLVVVGVIRIRGVEYWLRF
ncbi:MAG: hypothetical protein KatS3mg039_1094 [Candidatus Kapaibacterium sp.]|nr:MAG: hypothetical protein KatS3mg039_1094 [Candidatus Kapabacteria bacterium]